MNVKISKDAERFVRREMASGRYESPQQVIRDSLRLLEEKGLVEDQRRTRLNEQIAEGLAELDRGEGLPGEEVLRAIREKSRRRRHKAS